MERKTQGLPPHIFAPMERGFKGVIGSMRKQARIKRKKQRIRDHREKQSAKIKKCYGCGVPDNHPVLKCECVSYHHRPPIGENGDV